MPVDATGATTSPDGIPTYTTASDAPSGKGLNNIVTTLQSILLANYLRKPWSPGDGDFPVWDSGTSSWKRSSTDSKRPAMAGLGSGTPSSSTFLRGDGTWASAGLKTTVSAISGGPPGSPSDGDIWIATSVATFQRWSFQYNASGDPTYKWEFIGGPPIGLQYTTAIPGTATWTLLGGIPAPRPGTYLIQGDLEATNNAGGAGTVLLGAGTGVAETVQLAGLGITSASFQFSMSGCYTPGLTYTAGQSIGLWGWANSAPTGPNEFMRILPVRVA